MSKSPIWISRNGQTFGPYSPNDAKRMLKNGELLETDLGCIDGETWHPLTTFLGKKRKSGCVLWGGVAVLLILILGLCSTPRNGSRTATDGHSNASHLPAKPFLELQEWNWGEEHGYITAEGSVKNISDVALKNVQALVTFKSESGEFISSEDSLIKFNPILPGQVSPWKVMKTDNPAIKKASVTFKTFSGETIVWKKKGESESTPTPTHSATPAPSPPETL